VQSNEHEPRSFIVDPAEWELILGVRDGKEERERTLYERYRAQVHALATRMCPTGEDPDDLTQQIFVRAFRKIGQFKGESRFYTWLYRIAYNMLVDFRRAAKVKPLFEDISEKYDTDNCQQAKSLEMAVCLEDALRSLPEKQRMIIILHDSQGYTYEEIAEITGMPIGEVKGQRIAGLEKLCWLLNRRVPS
jgi:RNA polymerase sigma-70 factor (ECF subfamily)